MVKIVNKILDLAFVPRCGGCRERMDKLEIGLCKRCRNIYEDERAEYCDFCGMEASICNCVPPNLIINACYDYRKLVFYKTGGSGNFMHNMIYAVKRGHNRALIRFFAKEMLDLDKNSSIGDIIVTYAPRAQKAIKVYGYDHAKLLAKYYAKFGGYEFKPLLRRKWEINPKQQKLLNFKQRASNVKGAFETIGIKDLRGKTIVIIDDVVTSGATIGECSDVLYAAGAKNVICRSIAHTYRKNKHKKD